MKSVLEEWRPIVGYADYEVSDSGCFRRRRGEKVKYIKCSKDNGGYSTICLYKNGEKKTCLVHRIVYTAFNGTIPEGMQIDHINTVRDDNRLSNLRCVSPKENQNNSLTLSNMREAAKKRSENQEWKSRQSEAAKKRLENPQWRQKNREANRRRLNKTVLQLDKNTGEVIREWQCASDVERELGIAQPHISNCCHGRQKTAGGYRWRFALANCS